MTHSVYIRQTPMGQYIWLVTSNNETIAQSTEYPSRKEARAALDAFWHIFNHACTHPIDQTPEARLGLSDG